MKIDFIFPLRKTFPGAQFLLEQCCILIPYKEQKHFLQQTANATFSSINFFFQFTRTDCLKQYLIQNTSKY